MDYYDEEFSYVQNALKSSPFSAWVTRHMLVFINVLSGRGSAINVFIQAAKPYFVFAHIKYDVVAVTSPTSGLPAKIDVLQEALGCDSLFVLSGRISDYIQSMDVADMEKYDAFVVVGGDGTLGELATGCTLFAQRGKEENASKYPTILPDSELSQFVKPIGIIPAGSTDAVACTLFGSRDPHIAAISIALGSTCFLDIQAVFADGYFAKISLAAVGCGFLTETLIRVKRFSRFGQFKSILAGLFAFIQHKPFNVAVEYRPRETSRVPGLQTCTFACPVCAEWSKLNSELPKNSALSSKSEWRWAPMDPGAISALNTYTSPLRIPGALVRGLAPLCHLCDGTSHIFAISHSGGRFRLASALIASFCGCVGALYYQKNSLVKVTAIRSCCEYRFSVKPASTFDTPELGMLGSVNWNIDGEIIAANSIHSVVHSRLLKFFGTGGPLPSPGIFSHLFFARLTKWLMPFAVLRPSPLKQMMSYDYFIKSIEEKWHRSAIDAFLVRHVGTKCRCTSSSTGRLFVFCVLFALLVILLITFYQTSLQLNGRSDSFNVISQRSTENFDDVTSNSSTGERTRNAI